MSLRDLGVFAPLKKDHPSVGERCWKCSEILDIGTRVGLCATETPDQSGSLTVEAAIICANCHLKGQKVMTPDGPRIVEYVKRGDGSPFPVCTTDGKQWKDEEIT